MRVNTIRLEPGEQLGLHNLDLIQIGPWTLQVSVEAPVPGVSDRPEETPPATEEPPLSGAPTDSNTNPSIFLRLRADRTDLRELSWEAFARRYGPVITRFARREGVSAVDADDVLQDVLMGFFRVSDHFEYDPNKGRFRGSLKRATLNAIRARGRKRSPALWPDVAMADAAGPSDAPGIWEHEWARQQLEEALATARSEVEESTWQAFDLYGRHGVPDQEVGAELGMTPASVRKAKSRVAQRVRRHLQELRDEEG